MTHTKCLLADVLKTHGLRQQDFADAMGCAQSQVSKWCDSGVYPTIGTALRILEVLRSLTGMRFHAEDLWVVTDHRPCLTPHQRAAQRKREYFAQYGVQVSA